MMNQRSFWILCIALGGIWVSQLTAFHQPSTQVSLSQVARKCIELAKYLRIPIPEESVKPVQEKRNGPRGPYSLWRVHVGEVLFFVDGESGEVASFFDMRTALRSVDSKRTRLPLDDAEEQRLWQSAERLLKHLEVRGFSRWQYSPATDEASPGRMVSKIDLHFEERAHGYSTKGVGNDVSVSIDPRNQRILSFVVHTGWKYDKPKVLVSAKKAIEIAERHVRKKATSRHPVLGFIMPMLDAPSSRGRQFAREMRCRFGYTVQIERTSVGVDAENGEILGTFRH